MLRHEAVKKELVETTCRRNLTHTISLTRIFTGMPDAKIPASRQVGFLACASGGGGTKYFHRSTVPQTIIYSVTTCVASCTPLQIGIAPDLMFALIVSHQEHHRMFVQQYCTSWYSTRTSDTLLRYCTAVDGPQELTAILPNPVPSLCEVGTVKQHTG